MCAVTREFPITCLLRLTYFIDVSESRSLSQSASWYTQDIMRARMLVGADEKARFSRCTAQRQRPHPPLRKKNAASKKPAIYQMDMPPLPYIERTPTLPERQSARPIGTYYDSPNGRLQKIPRRFEYIRSNKATVDPINGGRATS